MLRVRLLGQISVERDDQALEPPASRRAWELLAWLALHPGAHPRGDVAARFWPDVLDSSARASLRSAVWALRRSLGDEEVLRATRDRIGLDGGVWVDVRAFDELVSTGNVEEAISLCGGELLAGIDDEWAMAARDEFRGRLLDALERLAADAEKRGDADDAVRWSRRQAAADPLDEEARRRLMRRLAAAGDGAGALAGYERFAARLRRELAVAPSRATRELAEELRSEGPRGPSAAIDAVPPRPFPLVGRERELAQLRAAWEAARSGAGGVVVLVGDAGIGKTRLAAELLAGAAEDGARVAACAALDLGGAAPLGLWAELAGRAVAGAEGRAAPPPELERARLFEAAGELLAWAAHDRPVAVLVEDTHLADAASLELLAYVGRRLARLGVLVVLTRRPLPRHAAADAAEQALRRRGVLSQELALGSLAPDALAALVAEVAALPGDSLREVLAAADGNPLLAVESARAAAIGEGGPAATLRATVRASFATLSPDARRLAELCAVAGRDVERSELESLGIGQPAEAALAAADTGLLVASRDRVGYGHALLRDAVYADLPEPSRAALHEAFAGALERGAATVAPRRAAEAARHLRLAGRDERAVGQLARAAGHARTVAALGEAAAFLREALEIAPDDPELLLDLAEVQMWLREVDAAEECFQRALPLLGAGNPYPAARAWLRRAYWHRGPACVPREVLISARRALELLDEVGGAASVDRSRALAACAWAEAVAGDPRRVGGLLDELEEAPADEDDLLLEHDVEQARQLALMREGRFRESCVHAARSGEAGERAERPDLAYGPWVNGAGAALCAGDFDEALTYADRALACVRGRWLPMCEVHARSARVTVLLCAGRAEDAAREAESALRTADRAQDAELRAIANEARGTVALAAGDHATAEAALADALDAPAPISRPLARLDRAEALIGLGRLDEAEQELRQTALEPVGPADMPETLVPRLTRLQGLVAARRNDPALAQRRLEEAADGWRRVAGADDAGLRSIAGLADLGRPGLGFLQPARELARVEDELRALQLATA